MKFDSRDRAILNALQKNGRLTNAELAEKANLSPSACLRRTRMLEDAGVIAGYTMLLNAKAVGLSGTAFVQVTLESQGREELDRFERAVADIPEIMECYLLAGQHDYMLRIAYRDAEDLERLHKDTLTSLPGVDRVQSTLTLRTVKRTTRMPV
ncbi:Lrp/AsnC family transcriptional regulator [Breoghania sp. L-A4]|uniref:Lrp/AsnC family transcriptional regulator n=1 Tax=Breoghania sp. L-A4 TaxID=2304600 RepID=UPI000E35A62F|nr:Lrp/AsnC family transcriptional regulator [Breoghania sp. L-A4]AXS39581.1 Lrp/AsnC family transcriptional regulator [Breoghania sp. L-A4]